MSLWECWYAVCEHVFKGCTVVGVKELMACIFTVWTVIMVACIPYFIVRGRRK